MSREKEFTFDVRTSEVSVRPGAEVTGGPKNRAHLMIPERIESGSGESGSGDSEPDALPVTAIGKSAFSGNMALVTVSLPTTLRSLGSFAFYGCASLRQISFYDSLTEVGDGAVRACPSLSRLILHVGQPTAPSAAAVCSGRNARPFAGLKDLLADTDRAVTVEIVLPNGRAVLYFPSYVNDFDEDTMARAIHPRIEGCGVAYREMVRRDRIDFRGYDSLFPRAEADGLETACKVALCRLMDPYELESGSAAETRYRECLRVNGEQLAARLIAENDGEESGNRRKELFFLLREKLLSEDACEYALFLASEQKKTEICGMLMEYLGQRPAQERSEADRETFEL